MAKNKFPIFTIGIMSGTSTDGIDGVILAIEKDGRSWIHSSLNADYPQATKQKIRGLVKQKITRSDESEGLDVELAQQYGDLANRLIQSTKDISIDAIGCHGQTIHHSPNSEPAFSLQICDAKELAKITNLTTITDFRAADIAAGGQGAPLAPAFHQAMFADGENNRCVINIGGISNITLLPANKSSEIIGFDTGPGNTLIDFCCRKYFKCEFDKDGEIAKTGSIQMDLLDLFLKYPYFEKPPPKSTGLEFFNQKWLLSMLGLWEGHDHTTKSDILTTVTALTARTIADQINSMQLDIDTAYICGGGAKNPVLMSMLSQLTPAKIESTSVLGIDPQWIEAAAFGWMAYRTLNNKTSTLPSVTGAEKPTIAGFITLP
jgi:anhydro-N-acetylmuramic acid kinase